MRKMKSCENQKELAPINYVLGECKQNICLANWRVNNKKCVQSVSMEQIR